MNKGLKHILRSKHENNGFTLLEILVVLTIVAFIAIAGVTSLTQFLKNKGRLAEAQQKIEAIQNAFMLFERDISYAIQRPITNNDGDLFASMEVFLNNPRREGELLQFSVALPIAGSSLQRIQRVSWQLIDSTLYRYNTNLLDYHVDNGFNNNTVNRQEILSGIDSVNIDVFMGSGDEASVKFLNERVIASEQQVEVLYNLPRLLSFSLEKNDGNTYQRLFYIQSKTIEFE